METENRLTLPIAALLFNIIPYILFLGNTDWVLLFLIGIFPCIGMILGIIALCSGRKRIGKAGMAIAIIAACWPVVFVATVLVADVVGAMTFTM